ncbi:MAG TPA: Zn-dependent hydrolase [Gammaproteobacteria bacterium]|nr:Zn-dependent hydrolase [Gammaproteobacteria bacterium]
MRTPLTLIALALLLAACGRSEPPATAEAPPSPAPAPAPVSEPVSESMSEPTLTNYATVPLRADLSGLGEDERRALVLMIRAAEIMDGLFWYGAYGDKDELLATIADPDLKTFARINYGPWDRLAGNRPFVSGVGDKPPGANFYPADMSREEFETWDEPDKTGQYSYVRRDAEGGLELVPYSVMHRSELEEAAGLLREAAALLGNEALSRYLELRAEALVSDEYQPSDMAWMDMKDNRIELVIGPIETYEDRLYGYRASFEAFVLIKDLSWSERLARFAAFLPELQRGLPVPEEYKAETPGADADLNAYDAIYYAGDANAGAKTIAINLPNDEHVQLEKGTRRLQLRNSMQAKFDKILVPIAQDLIAEDLQSHVTFNAFFSNVMFHEVAHGLGIKNTLDGRGTVREALREHASALEEAKADVLGLYMITELFDRDELHEGEILDHYVTFLAGLFRSVRFGAASAHGRANMIQFNYFSERGAFQRGADGRYRVDLDRMREAVRELAARILVLQGDGDHAGTGDLLSSHGVIRQALADDLARINAAGIPVDVVFDQGLEVAGLRN